MDTKDVIIHLIREDMRLHQFMAALRKLGIEVYGLDIDLMSVTGRLLNVKEEDYDAWMDVYISELSKCERLPVKPLGKNLDPLAERSYKVLSEFTGKSEQ